MAAVALPSRRGTPSAEEKQSKLKESGHKPTRLVTPYQKSPQLRGVFSLPKPQQLPQIGSSAEDRCGARPFPHGTTLARIRRHHIPNHPLHAIHFAKREDPLPSRLAHAPRTVVVDRRLTADPSAKRPSTRTIEKMPPCGPFFSAAQSRSDNKNHRGRAEARYRWRLRGPQGKPLPRPPTAPLQTTGFAVARAGDVETQRHARRNTSGAFRYGPPTH
jgi:hypothetical protein